MKKLVWILATVALVAGSVDAKAENKKTKKAASAISFALNNAEILKDYKDFKKEIYGKVLEVKALGKEESKLANIKKAYAQTQEDCDEFITQLITDLLDKDKRKELVDDPEAFNDKYSDQYNEIKAGYKNNFLVEYSNLTEKPAFFGGLAAKIFTGIIDFMKTFFKINKEYLVNHFKKPLLLKDWDKVDASLLKN